MDIVRFKEEIAKCEKGNIDHEIKGGVLMRFSFPDGVYATKLQDQSSYCSCVAGPRAVAFTYQFKGVMVDEKGLLRPNRVKKNVRSHFANRHKKQQAMVFKVDFAKAYDSVRWDYLDDCGLKQGDPLAPYLFILVMESLHLSVSRTVEAGIFTGIKIDSALSISHLFYADDAVFIGYANCFWEDLWLGEVPFNELFPRLYALENNKECSVAVKMQGEIDSSFCRHLAWDLNGGGNFVLRARDLVDEEDTSIFSIPVTCFSYFSLYVNGGTFRGVPVDSYSGWLEWFNSFDRAQA
ncbi:hypothetical protein Tco_0393128 [Tanacetum coccineum]